MLLAPITNRTAFYDTTFGGIRFLDWNLVNTAQGAMIEPRNLLGVIDQNALNVDQENSEISKLEIFDENKFFSTFNHGGRQHPVDVRL